VLVKVTVPVRWDVVVFGAAVSDTGTFPRPPVGPAVTNPNPELGVTVIHDGAVTAHAVFEGTWSDVDAPNADTSH